MAGKLSSELLRGSLDLMILSVLADEPMYGYSIQKRLAEASNNAVNMQAGTLYPLLHGLEDEKLIKSKWEKSTGRPRKWYELTSAGRKRLNQQASEWHSYVACLKQLLPSMAAIAKSGVSAEPA
jgi:DNA-binding PadR family transcriptional regulator